MPKMFSYLNGFWNFQLLLCYEVVFHLHVIGIVKFVFPPKKLLAKLPILIYTIWWLSWFEVVLSSNGIINICQVFHFSEETLCWYLCKMFVMQNIY
jgi:hypothetical protein